MTTIYRFNTEQMRWDFQPQEDEEQETNMKTILDPDELDILASAYQRSDNVRRIVDTFAARSRARRVTGIDAIRQSTGISGNSATYAALEVFQEAGAIIRRGERLSWEVSPIELAKQIKDWRVPTVPQQAQGVLPMAANGADQVWEIKSVDGATLTVRNPTDAQVVFLVDMFRQPSA